MKRFLFSALFSTSLAFGESTRPSGLPVETPDTTNQGEKTDRVTDREITSAISAYFDDKTHGAIENLARSVQLMRLIERADPAIVSEALRPHLADPKTIWSAVEMAGRTPEIARRLVPELTAAMKNSKSGVRYFAVRGLGTAGEHGAPAIPWIIEALKNDKDSQVREFSAEALGQIGVATPDVIRALFDAILREDDADMNAEEALLHLSFDPKPYLETFIACANLTLVPDAVLERMPEIGPAAIPPILAQAKTKDLNDTHCERDLVAAIGPAAGDALSSLLRGSDAHGRLLGFHGLATIRNQEGQDPGWIKSFLADELLDVRCAAISAFCESKAPVEDKLAVLRGKLAGAESEELKVACGNIAQLGSAASPLLGTLGDCLENHPENGLPIAFAMLALEPRVQSARAFVQKALNGQNEGTVKEVLWELRFRPAIAVEFLPQLKTMRRQSPRSVDFQRFLDEAILGIETFQPTTPGR